MRHAAPKRHPNAVHDDRHLDNVIKERGLVGYLSNAKWVKLIAALATHGNFIKECQVKLVWEKSYTGRRLLIDEDTIYNFDYYSNTMESMITGKPSGWHEYPEIEWLAFHRHPAGLGEQPIEAILAALTPIGQFAFTLTADYLQIDAYRAAAA